MAGYFFWGDLGPAKHTLFAFLFAGVLIVSLTQKSNGLVGILRLKLLTWIGSISYSLYLVHYLILGLVHHFLGRPGLGIHDGFDVTITLLALITSIGISWLIFRFVETPLVKIGKKLKY